MDIKSQLVNVIKEVIFEIFDYEDTTSLVMVEIPKDKNHGDFSTNVAMRLTKILKDSPLNIANKIVDVLKNKELIESLSIAGPGFINIVIKKESLVKIINQIIEEKELFGSSSFGKNEQIMVEYVSANPTGDLHLGHARGAAYGDSLTRILKFSGYDVLREYYVNDAGNQIEVLGNSLFERYKEALGQRINIEKIGYQGKDVKELAIKIVKQHGDKFLFFPEEETIDFFKTKGTELELKKIKKDLKLYRVEFDHYQSELGIYKEGKVKTTLNELIASGYTYLEEGALWLKTKEFGDDKDRVLVKKDGSYTYLLPDLAYHKDKFDRGYKKLINIFGADHHGYLIRLKAGLKILGYNPDNLEVEIIQIVRLMENGNEVKMSKRTGNAVTIRELCNDVGVDVARYFFISKPIVSHLDFDLTLARKNSSENPVYYIQYAYARACSILSKAGYSDIEIQPLNSYDSLKETKEITLLKLMSEFKNILVDVCKTKEVNILSNYAYKLAQEFHSYYNEIKIIDEINKELTNERIRLVYAISIVISNALNCLGIEAKKVM